MTQDTSSSLLDKLDGFVPALHSWYTKGLDNLSNVRPGWPETPRQQLQDIGTLVMQYADAHTSSLLLATAAMLVTIIVGGVIWAMKARDWNDKWLFNQRRANYQNMMCGRQRTRIDSLTDKLVLSSVEHENQLFDLRQEIEEVKEELEGSEEHANGLQCYLNDVRDEYECLSSLFNEMEAEFTELKGIRSDLVDELEQRDELLKTLTDHAVSNWSKSTS